MDIFRVVGEFEIAGKSKGEAVELDPAIYNVEALIDGGHIERIDTSAQVPSGESES